MTETYDQILEFLTKNKFQNKINKLAKQYKDKKIVIYGAGLAFEVITANFDLGELNITGISDIRFNGGEVFNGFKTIRPESLYRESPDLVLTFLTNPNVVEKYFKNYLFIEYGRFKYEHIFKFRLL